MGTGQIKIVKDKDSKLLKEIAREINLALKNSSCGVNMITCLMYLVLGLMMMFLSVDLMLRF
jgi:hypothetical protein